MRKEINGVSQALENLTDTSRSALASKLKSHGVEAVEASPPDEKSVAGHEGLDVELASLVADLGRSKASLLDTLDQTPATRLNTARSLQAKYEDDRARLAF